MADEFTRQLERLEDRLGRDNDRRFHELSVRLDKIEGKIENIESKTSDRTLYNLRTVVSLIVTFIMGLGASGFITILNFFLNHR